MHSITAHWAHEISTILIENPTINPIFRNPMGLPWWPVEKRIIRTDGQRPNNPNPAVLGIPVGSFTRGGCANGFCKLQLVTDHQIRLFVRGYNKCINSIERRYDDRAQNKMCRGSFSEIYVRRYIYF